MTTPMNGSVPIMFTGDVDGNFGYLFKKAQNVMEKAKVDIPFAMLICCGNFFGDNAKGWEEYASGDRKVSIPTYILGPYNKDQVQFYPKLEACELVPNVFYLGRSGIYVTGEGLKIAYISGFEGTKQRDCTFNMEEIDRLIASSSVDGETKVVDVLISCQWPYNITSSMEDPYTPHNPSRLLGHVVNKLRPQYHIATCEKKWFEREPFPHFDENGELLSYTRFVGLAAIGNSTKSKSIYALRIQKQIKETTPTVPLPIEDTSPNPFSYLTDEFDSSYSVNPVFFSAPSQSSKRIVDTEERIKKKTKFGDQCAECWFCLSNRTIDKHLIITVASECYLALAKGGVVDNHALISTIAHFKSANQLSEIASEEIVQYKMSLRQYFRSLKMEVIFYERSYKSTHLQIHCIPLAANLYKNFKPTLTTKALKENLELEEYPNGTMVYRTLPADCSYFYIDLPNDNEILIKITDDDFPINFGRDIIAENILKIPERSNWRKCVLDDEIAKAIVSDFRVGFLQYDFTDSLYST